MLEENYKLFEEKANHIDGWRAMSKNELCNLYIQHENDSSAEDYFSAIVCKYWPHINKHYALNRGLVDVEEVYEWVIDSIVFALENRRWTQEDSSVYQDVHGPDKVINRRLKCLRINYYVASNRYVRKLHHNMHSIEKLSEDDPTFDVPDGDLPISETIESEYDDLIIAYFSQKEYEMAFVLDIILHYNVFISEELNGVRYQRFDSYKLGTFLFKVKKDSLWYVRQFADRYALEEEKVQTAWNKSWKIYKDLGAKEIEAKKAYEAKAKEVIQRIRHSDFFKKLKGAFNVYY